MLTNLLNEDALLRDSFGVCNTFSSNSSVSGISSVFSFNDLKTALLGFFSEILYEPLCKIDPNKLRVKPGLSVIGYGSIDVGETCWRQIVTKFMSSTSWCHQHHCYLGDGQFGKQTKPPWVFQIIFLKLFSDTLLILLRLNFFWFHYLAARPEISFIIFCA